MMSTEYPKASIVRQGAILHSITNGIAIARCPGFARYLCWDGNNYVLNGGDGTYGAITFHEGSLVGVFFDAHSKFNPIGSGDEYDIGRFFQGMPALYRSLAESKTLRYNRQNYRGHVSPLITAAFWDAGEQLTAAFPWKDVFDNGAYIIRVELMERLEPALEEWRDAYQLSSDEVGLARSLFLRKMVEPRGMMDMAHPDVEVLKAASQGPQAMDACRQALEAIGIRVP